MCGRYVNTFTVYGLCISFNKSYNEINYNEQGDSDNEKHI